MQSAINAPSDGATYLEGIGRGCARKGPKKAQKAPGGICILPGAKNAILESLKRISGTACSHKAEARIGSGFKLLEVHQMPLQSRRRAPDQRIPAFAAVPCVQIFHNYSSIILPWPDPSRRGPPPARSSEASRARPYRPSRQGKTAPRRLAARTLK